MTTTPHTTTTEWQFPFEAYVFVDNALRYTQRRLGRRVSDTGENIDQAHVTGQELLGGIREYAQREFGLMARCIFEQWGIRSTEDFGKIVYELIDRGMMRKTPDDKLTDFIGVYDFETAFDRDYEINVQAAFSRDEAY